MLLGSCFGVKYKIKWLHCSCMDAIILLGLNGNHLHNRIQLHNKQNLKGGVLL